MTDNQNSKFVFIHHFPQTSSLSQIAHLVECEGLVWMVLGSSPGEVVFWVLGFHNLMSKMSQESQVNLNFADYD